MTNDCDDTIKTYIRQGTSTTTASSSGSYTDSTTMETTSLPPLNTPDDNCTTTSIIEQQDIEVQEENNDDNNNNNNNNNNNKNYYEYEYPIWYNQLIKEWDCERLIVNEFDESDKVITTSNDNNNISNDDTYENHIKYRQSNGWNGCDLIHNRYSPVRILQYYVKYGNGEGLPTAKTISEEEQELDQPTGQSQQQSQQQQYRTKGGINTCLYGIVYFTINCESHKNYCHGGSMCSIMDDIIGWTGFNVIGQCIPWCGYTVQINTKLYQPIIVNSILAITSKIIKIERRKIYIHATLYNPSISLHPTIINSDNNDSNTNNKITDKSIHATCEGIFVINKDVM